MARGFAGATPAERRMYGAVGGLTTWSRRTSPAERRRATQPARDGMRRKLAAEIDPDGILPADELRAAVDRLMRAHMRRMAIASAAKRRRADR